MRTTGGTDINTSPSAYPPVVVVDENDNETGSAMLGEVWRRGLYHRIVSVFVEDDKGRMLLQLRGPHVKVYPNCWDQAAGGHVDLGHSYEQTARDEAAEELDIHNLELKELGTFKVNKVEDDRIINQFERVYSAKIPHNTALKLQADEVSQLKWFETTELKERIAKNPERFTPGLLYCLKTYFPTLHA